MILQTLKQMIKCYTKAKEPKQNDNEKIDTEIKDPTLNEINERLDEILTLADNNGLTHLTREHIKSLLTTPWIFDKSNDKQLLLFLRSTDLKLKMLWEEQVSAYIRVPVRSVFAGPGTSTFKWR